jgi:hypothetical protein
MLKKTVAGAALMAAALATSAMPAFAHAASGAAGLTAHAGATAQPVAYYRYGHPVTAIAIIGLMRTEVTPIGPMRSGAITEAIMAGAIPLDIGVDTAGVRASA